MKLKERFRITEFKNPSGNVAFRVSGYMPDGKQIRENKKSLEEAMGRKGELEIQAMNLPNPIQNRKTRLTDAQLALAEAAFQKIGEKSLLTAVDFYLRNYHEPITEKPVEVALEEFMAEKKAANLREASLINLRTRVNRLVKANSGKKVHEIQPVDIKAVVFVPGRKPQTTSNERRALSSFFSWCLRQGFVQNNPVEKIEHVKVERGTPEILSLDDCKALLRAARKFKQKLFLPYVCLSLFAGLRPTELRRLKSAKIDLTSKLLTIDDGVAKMRARRTVELSKNLLPWLRLCKNKPLAPRKNFQRDFDALKKLAGFSGRAAETDKEEDLRPWVPDVMRHTAISAKLAVSKNEAAVADWAGNSPDVIHRHYKGLMSPTDAQAFWNIRPSNLE